jgi:hypothetical protein
MQAPIYISQPELAEELPVKLVKGVLHTFKVTGGVRKNQSLSTGLV